MTNYTVTDYYPDDTDLRQETDQSSNDKAAVSQQNSVSYEKPDTYVTKFTKSSSQSYHPEEGEFTEFEGSGSYRWCPPCPACGYNNRYPRDIPEQPHIDIRLGACNAKKDRTVLSKNQIGCQ